MMRGGNREMRRMMDKMGLDMKEIPNVQEVIIKTDKKEIIVSKPSVTEMKAKDNSIFTVTADCYEERELDVPIFSDEDIQLVSQKIIQKLKVELLGLDRLWLLLGHF